jgi:hypothetical protein
MAMGFQAMGTFTEGTLTPMGDALAFKYAGTGTFINFMCTFSATGTLVRGTVEAGAPGSSDAGTD